MTKQDLAKTGSMIAQEVLTALHLPGSVALSRSVESALKKRFDDGVRALIDELGRAGADGLTFGEEDHDEFVQMLLRFHDNASRHGDKKLKAAREALGWFERRWLIPF